MPGVYPFRAAQYKGGRGDVSRFVAPPYDVIGAAEKQALLAADERNVVSIDLPHTPAKELGPPEAYQSAAGRYRAWLDDGTLAQRGPAMFAYRQTFDFLGRRYQRCGMACTVEVVPFGPREGGGVLPHEQTFSGPKEDRFALMKAARAQFSPIFGLHADDAGRATALIHQLMDQREPDMTARMDDGVLHEVWTVDDARAVKSYQDALAGEDVFIADGHHRYTTAINYLKHFEETNGPVGPDHPARRCMIVLVGMSDPGLAIGPTHRVLGGMEGYSIEQFTRAASAWLDVKRIGEDPHAIEPAMAGAASKGAANALGLLDFATGGCFIATLKNPDPLQEQFPDKPEAWRKLDVALIQHLIVDQICRPQLNGGEEIRWAFPHSVEEVLQIGSGAETGAGGGAGFAQLAVIVRPTPLDAVRQISRANELMPQKSTFFYPKLATGLFLNPLE